ncbi:DEAD/DEAH box helicase [Mucilaginibacter mali]|uniref:DEAD-box ATP-dependent RNA helicase RhpA n=1 Tax=Mucilaginibacter mali TaxID=2740462 RepID=A0A7D4UDY8_9SPHI|nr:DEAD/DEAH box helicase [Mucilaginibacter mali]QKJ28316.1 DEAD/DEAH box helicase [Mucilaginibacter mali]
MSFQDLNLIEPILRALKTEGYTTPTPIQAKSIPIILKQRDLLGCAQTGTGKTAAFSIPILQLLYQDKQQHKEQKTIKTLILTPTRELAIQIDESIAAYGRHTGLKHLVIFGGVSQNPQTDALKRGVDILVATPGRLLDLMNQGFIRLDHLKILVLDEADRMLDMGFVHDVKKIIAKVPKQRQTLFFSATMPPEIQQLADTILYKPEKVEVAPVSSTADTIQQTVYFVGKEDKRGLLHHLLKDKSIATVLVFTRTKHGADKVVKDLSKAGITAEAIHGNKSQNARQRALTNFKNRTTRVLVATDIAARGIDIDDLTHVINYEIPNIPETYVHRIGRTGRAGASGIAFSFCDEEEKEFLKDIHKLIAKTIPVEEEHPFPMKQLTQQERILKDLKNNPHHKSGKPAPRNQSAQRNPNANKAGGNRNWRRSRNKS